MKRNAIWLMAVFINPLLKHRLYILRNHSNLAGNLKWTSCVRRQTTWETYNLCKCAMEAVKARTKLAVTFLTALHWPFLYYLYFIHDYRGYWGTRRRTGECASDHGRSYSNTNFLMFLYLKVMEISLGYQNNVSSLVSGQPRCLTLNQTFQIQGKHECAECGEGYTAGVQVYCRYTAGVQVAAS